MGDCREGVLDYRRPAACPHKRTDFLEGFRKLLKTRGEKRSFLLVHANLVRLYNRSPGTNSRIGHKPHYLLQSGQEEGLSQSRGQKAHKPSVLLELRGQPLIDSYGLCCKNSQPGKVNCVFGGCVLLLRECNAEHPLFFPIRPIAKSFCEVWRLIPFSRFSSAILFLICCLLLFISYVLTKHVTEYAQDLVFGTIEDRFKRKMVLTLGGWAIQLLVSNSSFFLFRVVLAGIVYAIYQLGRDLVFSLLLLLLSAAISFCCFEYYQGKETIDLFFYAHRLEAVGTFSLLTLILWYWRRYVFKNKNNHSVFDHDVGAALVQLRH
jgi:hypothetical protein